MELALDTRDGPWASFEETPEPTPDQVMDAVDNLDSSTHTEVSLSRGEPFEYISISGGPDYFLISGESGDETFVKMTTPDADPNKTVQLVCGGQQNEFNLQAVVPRNRVREAVEQFFSGLSGELPEVWSVE